MNWFELGIALGRLALDIVARTDTDNARKARDVSIALDAIEQAGADVAEFVRVRRQARDEGRQISDAELAALTESMNEAVQSHNALTPEDVRR